MTRRFLLQNLVAAGAFAQPGGRKTRNVFLVSTDGLRWQEVFRGADPALLNKEQGHVADLPALKASYWRESPTQRRAALMPFLWSAIARNGQLWGNRDLGSDAYVTNGKNFSYPGYNELLTGAPDDRIDSNDKKPNPNINVFEWLHRKPAFRDKVAAFAAWDCLPFILNAPRAGFLVNGGYDPYPAAGNPHLSLLNRVKKETALWDAEPMDAPVYLTALEHLRTKKPRALYISLGETDEWAHEGRYDLYLQAAHRVDTYLKELWETAQSMPEYRDQTTLLVAVDHGRGEGSPAWRSHGAKLAESKYVWFGVMGPDTPPLGERGKAPPVTESQVAASVAALLGEDYLQFRPQAGKPLPDLFR
ncbi:MAG: alkaline phosphatase family protein [Bryobacterales bacterium]|nr:alkaline phosphatase family protein [Bryobacterales bacterium]